MPTIFNIANAHQLQQGVKAAGEEIANSRCVVIPTDTVYGIACCAFDPQAVDLLLSIKGRGRDIPPPVLVSGTAMFEAMAGELSPLERKIVRGFMPGGLTLVTVSSATLAPSVCWQDGTIALRIPKHPIIQNFLKETGPLAVSSANKHKQMPAETAQQAADQLGQDVNIILDGGSLNGASSTIVDARGGEVKILRAGCIHQQKIFDFLT